MRLLKDYDQFMEALFASIVDEGTLTSDIPLDQILRQPKLIVGLNHATPISWVPAMAFLSTQVTAAGGGDRLPIGVMDKFFYSNPFTLPVAEYITQSKVARDFDRLLHDLKELEQVDLVVFPEGSLTFFGSSDKIHPFRSSRFIELSVRARIPILLAVHRGSESWSRGLPIPREWGALLMPFSPWIGKGVLETGLLNFPLPLHKIPRFSMHLHLYSPALYESDLAENSEERRVQLDEEGEKIRALMQEIWDGLPG